MSTSLRSGNVEWELPPKISILAEEISIFNGKVQDISEKRKN